MYVKSPRDILPDESPRFRNLLRVLDAPVLYKPRSPCPSPVSDTMTMTRDEMDEEEDEQYNNYDLLNVEKEPFPEIVHSINWVNGITSRFKCLSADCPRTYQRKGDLKYHVKKDHPFIDISKHLIPKSTREDKPFGCPIETCPCGFKLQRDLTRHLKIKHYNFYKTNFDEKGRLLVASTEKIDFYPDEIYVDYNGFL